MLIDADNVPAKHAEAILREVSGIGEPALRRVYGDWSADSLNGWSKVIPELGLVARQETANTKQKNASDIGLVIDAMDKIESETGWYALSGIGSKINTAHPDFDARTYGHKKLSSLVAAIPKIETKTEGTLLFIRIKH